MKKISFPMAVALGLFSSLAQADNFSYNQLQLTVNNTELKASDGTSSFKDDDTGFGISGTLRLPRSFYLAGSYETVDISGVDFTNYSVGIGAFSSVAEGVDLFAELAYVNEEVKINDLNFNEDDGGYGITLGARGQWTPTFEAEARYRYADLGSDWDPIHSFYLSGMYKITDQFGLGLSFRRDSIDEAGIDITRKVIGAFVRATF